MSTSSVLTGVFCSASQNGHGQRRQLRKLSWFARRTRRVASTKPSCPDSGGLTGRRLGPSAKRSSASRATKWPSRRARSCLPPAAARAACADDCEVFLNGSGSRTPAAQVARGRGVDTLGRAPLWLAIPLGYQRGRASGTIHNEASVNLLVVSGSLPRRFCIRRRI